MMPVTLEQFGLEKLTTEERLEFVELLCDRLSHETATPPE
jgi:hypothetical protein